MSPAPAAPPHTQQQPHILARAWDRVSIYLPVLLMALLALISVWLLKTTPQAKAPEPPRQEDHKPDYFMRNFSVRQFGPEGELKTILTGDFAQHYPGTQALVVQAARLRTDSDSQRRITGQAQRLTINDAHTHYLLEQDVHILQAPPPANPDLPTTSFSGNSMLIRTDVHTISAQQPVRILRGKDTVTAQTMLYHDDQHTLSFQGQVRTTLASLP